jgi:hypothetical protein
MDSLTRSFLFQVVILVLHGTAGPCSQLCSMLASRDILHKSAVVHPWASASASNFMLKKAVATKGTIVFNSMGEQQPIYKVLSPVKYLNGYA